MTNLFPSIDEDEEVIPPKPSSSSDATPNKYAVVMYEVEVWSGQEKWHRSTDNDNIQHPSWVRPHQRPIPNASYISKDVRDVCPIVPPIYSKKKKKNEKWEWETKQWQFDRKRSRQITIGEKYSTKYQPPAMLGYDPVDKDGWEYSTDLKRFDDPERAPRGICRWSDKVRRRRWVRFVCATKIPDNGEENEAEGRTMASNASQKQEIIPLEKKSDLNQTRKKQRSEDYIAEKRKEQFSKLHGNGSKGKSAGSEESVAEGSARAPHTSQKTELVSLVKNTVDLNNEDSEAKMNEIFSLKKVLVDESEGEGNAKAPNASQKTEVLPLEKNTTILNQTKKPQDSEDSITARKTKNLHDTKRTGRTVPDFEESNPSTVSQPSLTTEKLLQSRIHPLKTSPIDWPASSRIFSLGTMDPVQSQKKETFSPIKEINTKAKSMPIYTTYQDRYDKNEAAYEAKIAAQNIARAIESVKQLECIEAKIAAQNIAGAIESVKPLECIDGIDILSPLKEIDSHAKSVPIHTMDQKRYDRDEAAHEAKAGADKTFENSKETLDMSSIINESLSQNAARSMEPVYPLENIDGMESLFLLKQINYTADQDRDDRNEAAHEAKAAADRTFKNSEEALNNTSRNIDALLSQSVANMIEPVNQPENMLTACARVIPGMDGIDLPGVPEGNRNNSQTIHVMDATLISPPVMGEIVWCSLSRKSKITVIVIAAISATAICAGLVLNYTVFDNTIKQNNIKKNIQSWASGNHKKEIKEWDVSQVRDMSFLFDGIKSNFDIWQWDTARVSVMIGVFRNATLFNSDIKNWDVSNVVEMQMMFQGASSFNQDISHWDIAKVLQMNSMFEGAFDFTHDLSSWNVSNVQGIRDMFKGAVSYNFDLCWDFSESGLTVDNVFQGSAGCFCKPMKELVDILNATKEFKDDAHLSRCNYGKLKDWDVSKFTDFTDVFKYHENLTGTEDENINSWDVSAVVYMNDLFARSGKFDGSISLWDVSNVKELEGTFEYTDLFNQDLNAWDVSSVTKMRATFYKAGSFDKPLNNWDVSSCLDMQAMFSISKFDHDISMWDVSKVVKMKRMFHQNGSINQTLTSWDVSKVTDCRGIFDTTKKFNNTGFAPLFIKSNLCT